MTENALERPRVRNAIQSKNASMEEPLMLTGVMGRMRGLKSRKARCHSYVILAPCNDIHTFSMDDCIDVAFFGSNGTALAVFRNVAPYRRLHHPKACLVAERIASRKPWFQVGDALLSAPRQRRERPREERPGQQADEKQRSTACENKTKEQTQ